MLTAVKWLRTSKAAQLIGVSRATLTNMGNRGEGPRFTVIGSERRYQFNDVIAWLASRETGGEEVNGET